MKEVPKGWVEVELGEVWCESRSRVRPNEIPPTTYIGLEHIESGTNRIAAKGRSDDVKSAVAVFSHGDVLYGRLRPYLNKVIRSAFAGVASTEVLVFKETQALANAFLMYLLSSSDLVGYASANSAGVNLPRVSAKRLAEYRFPLAPLPEQHRIVAKIKSLFAKLDGAVDALQRAQANLERYRASVLKAAVEGRLTERWRSENPPGETGEELVKRTPTPQRPNRYGTRFRGVVAGHSALSLGATGLPLPSSWCWAPLVDLARLESGHTPSRRRPDWWDGDVPWVGIKDARAHHGGTIHKTLQMTNEAGLANSAARLLPANTVCLSRTASVGYVVVLGRPMATSQDFVNWICTEGLDPKWLQIVFLADPKALRKFGKGSTHTTIYFPEALSLHVAVPPLPEQRVIATEVDKRLRDCAKQETLLKRAHTRATALRQSILKRAFEGRLVPQDPANEPASVLLGRIRAQRRVRS